MDIDYTIDNAIYAVQNCIDQKIEKCKEVILSALMKQVPLKLKPDNKYYGIGRCPVCDCVFFDKSTNYCGNCGQKLDFKEE